MGYCFSYNSLITDNKSEDFCREILRTFKAMKISIESIASGLLPLKEQIDRLDYLKDNIFDSSTKNSYLKYHEALLNIPNSTLSFDNNQFIILKLLTISSNSDDKLSFLKAFFHIETLENLLLIIKTVIKINLLSYNSIILQIVTETNESKELIGLMENVYSRKHIDDFIDLIENRLKLLIGPNDENSIGNNAKFWIEAKDILAFYLNCIELRHYFYLKYENE